jgi:alanine dehydrogenase
METVILTQEDVESLISMREAIDVVEEAFKLYALGEAQMPPKVYLTFESGDLRAMPASLMGYAGVKWVNSHPENPKKGFLTVMAVLILNDPSNGFPIAVMDATYITSLRTGAAGGVAAKHLARKDSEVFGFMGCGRQSYFQLEALKEIFDIKGVLAYDVSNDAAKKFAEYCELLGYDCKITEPKEVCKCDVLTTTTPATKPVVMSEWVEEGMHINAIGADAPGKQELEEKILLRSKIVVDDFEQAWHGGEINVAVSRGLIDRENIYASIGEIIAGMKSGRESDDEITVFDSTGLAIQDVATAKVVYEKASQKGVGTKLKMFKE